MQPEPLYDGGLQTYLSHTYKLAEERRTGTSTARNPLDLGTREHLVAVGANYGLSDDLLPGVTKDVTVALNIPLVYRNFRTSAGGGVVDADFLSLGDIGLFARKRYLWHVPMDDSGAAYHFSVAAGVEAPTGTSSLERDGVRLPRSLQPGRGGYSATFAHMAAFEFDKLELFATTIYRWRSIAESDFEFGDAFSQEFKVAYRIVEEEYPGQSISPSLGLRYEASTPSRLDGTKLANSGSRKISLLPGIVWHAFAYSHDVGFGLDINMQFTVPVFQGVNGTQGVTEFSFRSSIAFRF